MATSQPPTKDLTALATQILELSKSYDPAAKQTNLEREIVTKARELIAAVQTPRDYMTTVLRSIMESSAFRALLSLGAIQAIPPTDPITLADLESKTGAQASLLKRLFRPVVQGGIITLHPDGTYSHTPMSAVYARDEGDVASLYNYMFDEAMVQTGFAEYFQQRGAREPDGELATTHNPRTWHARQEGKTVFEILEQDPEHLRAFQKLMVMATRFRPYTGFYDFGKLVGEEGRTVIVDVGGADGTTVAKILEAHPDIKPEQCVVQDREQVIELAKKNEGLQKGVRLQAHDFFLPQPVKGAKAYHLRAICHDWSDTMVVKILKHLADAAAKDSKVLIADVVMPEGPLGGMAAFMDLGMLCIGGKERTKQNFEEVLGAAGWELDAIYPSGYESGFSIVEASLK
ncbi:catechol O-methyltransferase [Neohortaea acidophila]|uniref:Catechol O-methyltransferase n=1 Tax=Neohortaea acidophila TaxID=245834 RepID=A0A6A6PNI9_9PEZI|nr:catechol O-methyltransferase [Neohortaea acidophila]KAF2481475.1 catechol O-methyltransferase [Neohortaea acidophila]